MYYFCCHLRTVAVLKEGKERCGPKTEKAGSNDPVLKNDNIGRCAHSSFLNKLYFLYPTHVHTHQRQDASLMFPSTVSDGVEGAGAVILQYTSLLLNVAPLAPFISIIIYSKPSSIYSYSTIPRPFLPLHFCLLLPPPHWFFFSTALPLIAFRLCFIMYE